MLTNELIARVRRIEITTRQLVEDGLAGEYHSVFKGRGMEFDEVRQYIPGDDVRSIDWNVTARTGEPYVKSYVEERELTVMLAVDVSRFRRLRHQELLQARAGSRAGRSHVHCRDDQQRQGWAAALHRQDGAADTPFKGPRSHVLRMLRDLLAFEPAGTGTDIRLALDTIYVLLKRRSIVFLISDFLADAGSYRQAMLVTNRRHDVAAFDISDPLEREMADVGVIALEDAETGRQRLVDTGDRQWRRDFAERVARLDAEKSDVLAAAGVDRVRLTTERDYIAEVGAFFKNRLQRMSR